MSEIADAAVARFVLHDFRDEVGRSSSADEQHLAACAEASVAHMDGENGTYGCDTGCEYARLTAQIECPHGRRVEHEYGDFGEIADILEEIQRDERSRETP